MASEWASPKASMVASEHSLPRRFLRAMRRWNPKSCRALSNLGNQDFGASSPYDEKRVCTREVEVALHRDEGGNLGFSLRDVGQKSNDAAGNKALVITRVKPGGPAYRSGCIRVGDRLLAVEGVSLLGLSLQRAHEILRAKSNCSLTKLTLQIDVVQPTRTLNRKGPFLIELHKTGGDPSMGISMTNDKGIVVAAIQPGSVAYRSRSLEVGDQIVAVNGCVVTSQTEVLHLIGISPALFQMEISAGRRDGSAKSLKPPSSPTTSSYRLGGSTSTLSSNMSTLKSHKFCKSESTSTLHERSFRSRSHSQNSVSHCETLAVTLHTATRGSGITLEGSWPPVIADIEPGSPADLCGCLQPGDRILIINQTRCDCLAGAEASILLSQSSPILKLHVQFDVLEAVVPSSGVFYVKLARNGTTDLGISVSPMKMPGNAPIISKIRRGSVAHRSGALQCGDQLLEICGARPGTQEDVIRVLQLVTQHEIISLKVLKCVRARGSYANNTIDKNVHTVDLVRMGGPLGLTISGAEQRDMPITISALKSGGLAESTGALNVGDQLLSINGYTLNGCKLSEVYDILQNSKDTVTLQVARSEISSPSASFGTFGIGTGTTNSWKSSTESDLSTECMDQSEDGECLATSLREAQIEVMTKLVLNGSQNSVATSCLSDIQKVSLYKDNVYEDFGFSVSDGLYERGVYVNMIRKGGPADKILEQYDRILQVNNTPTQDFDCCLTVPIIAAAGEKIDLVIARNPFAMVASQQQIEDKEWVADKIDSGP
ncbi:glutamate receptor-interacting protein 1 isoform X2 [Neocloeon triangulifer]|uniref:glutamate receptor-interacting protein 1 isoform X2 n=1 Tax=Neocloeon triangulifer TaxID=2078957 RepID=UPI00286ED0AB|nr:glutamate receptor-interacting protein 1 isoform X2 [Neocloeon triangulifer]